MLKRARTTRLPSNSGQFTRSLHIVVVQPTPAGFIQRHQSQSQGYHEAESRVLASGAGRRRSEPCGREFGATVHRRL